MEGFRKGIQHLVDFKVVSRKIYENIWQIVSFGPSARSDIWRLRGGNVLPLTLKPKTAR